MTGLNRRQLLTWLTCTALAPVLRAQAEASTIRIGITPVFLTERTSLLREWRDYLKHHLGQPVSFEQSDSYRDIINNLLARRLDFAWICGFPFVTNRTSLKLTAVPLYQGKPLYRSYLIVPAHDTSTRSLSDLYGRLFAFTDPDSNSGFLVPRYELLRQGLDPDNFFRKSFFTRGHRNAIEAVSAGLADGAHVDGYIWDTLARFSPNLTRHTRVVSKSRPFGFPPFVAGPSVSDTLNHRMRNLLLAMQQNPAALTLLQGFNLDGFTQGKDELYQEIVAMVRAVGEAKHVP